METNFPYDLENQDTDSEAVESNDPSVVSVALQERADESEKDELATASSEDFSADL